MLQIYRIYDPLGLLSSITIKYKLALQWMVPEQLWWDVRILSEQKTSWSQVDAFWEMVMSTEIIFPRGFVTKEAIMTMIELLGFCEGGNPMSPAWSYVCTCWNKFSSSRITDEKERRFGLKIIREKIRKGSSHGNFLPCKFHAPQVNFRANNLMELNDWDKVKLSEPLLTATMTTEELVRWLDTPLVNPDTWRYHSLSMERAIRKVSESFLMVVGEKKREEWIRCAEESRKVFKKPNSKADYMSLFDLPLE